jgi:hypothetical protein
MIFLMPVGRNITGVGRELHDVGIIQRFAMQPFALSLVLYTKPARKMVVKTKDFKTFKNIKDMKNSIKNLIALSLTVVALTGSALVTKAADNEKQTVLTDVKKVSKINVSGNVELILVQSADENVKVYNDYYASNALVQQKNGELRISSFNKETLTVIVYVTNLTSITASDNATVKTSGKFSTLNLDVNLNDKATANLNTSTISLNANVTGQANLTLSGTTEDYYAVLGSLAKLNMNQFAAENTDIKTQNISIASVVAPVQLEIAEL